MTVRGKRECLLGANVTARGKRECLPPRKTVYYCRAADVRLAWLAGNAAETLAAAGIGGFLDVKKGL